MRYLAILKDSLREARDSWVLFGLLALATLVILFVAQLSFHPQTAEKSIAYFFSRQGEPPVMFQAMNARKPEKMMAFHRNASSARLQKVDLVRGEPDSPQSDYALTIRVDDRHGGMIEIPPPPAIEEDKGDEKKEVKKKPVDVKKDIEEIRKVFADAEEVGYLKVGDIVPIADAEKDGGRLYKTTWLATSDTHRIWGTEPGLAFGLVRHEIFEIFGGPLSWCMYRLAGTTIGFGSWVAVLLSIVITSFFFPNMLRKGRIDLLLVKPISRWLLLFYKYLGGLSFIFLTTAYAVGGMWFVLGLRSGLWANGALLLIPSITFFFAILYAVSTFVGVVTRSVVASILLTIGTWFVLWIIGTVHSGVEVAEKFEKDQIERRVIMKQAPMPDDELWSNGWTFRIIHLIHAVSPRTEDLNQLDDLIIYTDFMTGDLTRMASFDKSERRWSLSVLVSCCWIFVFLGLAIGWFYWKDY